MGSQRVHIMKKGKLLILCVISELSVIILVAGANIFEGTMFYVFYNLLYGLGVSITVPLVIMLRQGTGLGGASFFQSWRLASGRISPYCLLRCCRLS